MKEKQRDIGVIQPQISGSQAAFAVKSVNSKNVSDSTQKFNHKDRPLCTHCGVYGHVKEKCFKLHGFPPGYKKGFKNRNVSVNQVSNSISLQHGNSTIQFTPEQYQQLLSVITTQISQATKPNVQPNDSSPSSPIGSQQFEGDWKG